MLCFRRILLCAMKPRRRTAVTSRHVADRQRKREERGAIRHRNRNLRHRRVLLLPYFTHAVAPQLFPSSRSRSRTKHTAATAALARRTVCAAMPARARAGSFLAPFNKDKIRTQTAARSDEPHANHTTQPLHWSTIHVQDTVTACIFTPSALRCLLSFIPPAKRLRRCKGGIACHSMQMRRWRTNAACSRSFVNVNITGDHQQRKN